MPIFQLSSKLAFPSQNLTSDEGILAIGGDLSPERLLLAYSQGIFPWPHEGYPLLWFCPDPRFVLDPRAASVGRSLQKAIRKGVYEIRCDTSFRSVMIQCASTARPDQDGTWITDEMIEGYSALFEMGYAHSIETFLHDKLVGGLYGISLGGIFFGESMFAIAPDASKVAFATLLAHLITWDFDLVDCQSYTEHLARFGADHWPRQKFLNLLQKSLTRPSRRGRWQFFLSPNEVLATLSRPDISKKRSLHGE